jgi:Tc toxin complex TcA C-terminal TcB-binding domain
LSPPTPDLNNGAYARDAAQDDRFVDYFGATDVIVTSSGASDSGMFETNLRDERFLPFEGAGAISSWTLTLPPKLRPFDYMSISDVILHIHYTAREAGDPLGSQAMKELTKMLAAAGQSSQALMFNLRYEFPSEWAAFAASTTANFTATLRKDYFPYMVQSARTLSVDKLTLYAESGGNVTPLTPQNLDLAVISAGLSGTSGAATLTLPSDSSILTRDPLRQVFLVLQYSFVV